MHRIDNATAASTLPTVAAVGPNPNGYWTAGNPGGGVPPTILDEDAFNAQQEELMNILTQASVTPVKGTFTQVLTALRNLLRGASSQAFTASGNFTVPAGVTSIEVEVWGAGSGSYNSQSGNPSGGGGAGGYARRRITGLTPGAVIPVVIGAAGAINGGDTAFGGAVSGAAGSQTVTGAYVYATGGAMNPLTSGGAGPLGNIAGTGVGGDLNITGSQGGNASGNSGGTGGAAPLGGGSLSNAGGAATAGNFPGGGAAGAGTGSGGTTVESGASGSPGYVVVRW